MGREAHLAALAPDELDELVLALAYDTAAGQSPRSFC